MSFQVVEDFHGFAANENIHNRQAANGQLWKVLRGGNQSVPFKVVRLGGKKVLWCQPLEHSRAYLPLATPFTDGHTSTLFFRIRYTGWHFTNFSVGLSDDPDPLQTRRTVSMALTTIDGPHVTVERLSTPRSVLIDNWYYVWMVCTLDSTAESELKYSYKVWVQLEGSSNRMQLANELPIPSLLNPSAKFPLRSYAGGPLETFVIYGLKSVPFYISDILVDTEAENLANPLFKLVDEHGQSTYTICFEPLSGESHDTNFQAAQILQEYVKKSTGCELAIKSTADLGTSPLPQPNIFVGNSRLLDDYQDILKFTPEQYIISARFNDTAQSYNLVLAGHNLQGDPWNFDATLDWRYNWLSTPTLHAVARFVEEFLGARWYWPTWASADVKAMAGKLVTGFGESYADLRGSALRVSTALNIHEENPGFTLRNLQLPCMPRDFSPMGFSYPDESDNPHNSDDTTGNTFSNRLARRYSRWMRLNHLGAEDQIWVKHNWSSLMPQSKYQDNGTWKQVSVGSQSVSADKYFALNLHKDDANPKGVLVRGGEDGQICVTGPEGSLPDAEPVISHLLLNEILARIAKSTSRCISIASNDGMNHHCQCPTCKLLDLVKDKGTTYDTVLLSNPSSVSDLSEQYYEGIVNIGDRYFTFFNQLFSMINPPIAWVTTFAYQSHVLPYGVQHPEIKPTYLNQPQPTPPRPKLIIFDTHNTYCFRFCDEFYSLDDEPQNTNAQYEQNYRMQMWGRTGANLMAWADPYWHGADFLPVFSAMPLACNATADNSKATLVYMLSQMRINNYVGAYFVHGQTSPRGYGKIYGSHWQDLYLLAQLLWDDETDGKKIASDEGVPYIDQLDERAAAISADYYAGLFGNAAGDVETFHQIISDKIAEFISDKTTSQPFYDFLPTLTFRTFFEEVFKDIAGDLQASLTTAFTQRNIKEGSREYAHLLVIQKNWDYTRLTIKMLTVLDTYIDVLDENNITETILEAEGKLFYNPSILSAARNLGTAMDNRSRLVREVNDENTSPDFCTLVLPPAVVHAEDPLEVTAGTQEPPTKITLGGVRKTALTTLAIQNNVATTISDDIMGDYFWPVGLAPHYRPDGTAISDEAGAVRLPYLAVNMSWTGDVWIDWFSRVGNIIYLVIVNDYISDRHVDLTLKLDPNDLTPNTPRSFRYFRYDGNYHSLSFTYSAKVPPTYPNTQVGHFDPLKDTNNPNVISALAPDTVSFDAPPGISIMQLNDANFAPYADTLDIPPHQNTGFDFMILDVVDDDWANRKNGYARLYVTKTVSGKKDEWLCPYMAERPHRSTYWAENVQLPDNPTKGDKYDVRAVVYDTFGLKREVVPGSWSVFTVP